MAFWACYLSGDSRIVPQILDTCPLNPWVLQPILDEVHKKMKGCSDRKGGEGLQEVRVLTFLLEFLMPLCSPMLTFYVPVTRAHPYIMTEWSARCAIWPICSDLVLDLFFVVLGPVV